MKIGITLLVLNLFLATINFILYMTEGHILSFYVGVFSVFVVGVVFGGIIQEVIDGISEQKSS